MLVTYFQVRFIDNQEEKNESKRKFLPDTGYFRQNWR